MRPCAGTPLGPPAGFLAHLPAAAAPPASALGIVVSCGVGTQGGTAPGQTDSPPVGSRSRLGRVFSALSGPGPSTDRLSPAVSF